MQAPLSLPACLLTLRLCLRPFTLADANKAFAWLSDPEVMRFIPGGRDTTLTDTRRRIQRYLDHGTTYGFTKWLVTDRATGEAIGDGGLYTLPGDPRVELGFRLTRSCWGQGYAQETGTAWIHAWREHRPDAPLYGIVLPDHQRSQRVLRKLGFELQGVERVYGADMQIHRLPDGLPSNQY